GLIAQRDLPLRDVFDRYELYIYKQWLRVYMRSKMIKHNKDLFECIDDPLALLSKLHIYSDSARLIAVTVTTPSAARSRCGRLSVAAMAACLPRVRSSAKGPSC